MSEPGTQERPGPGGHWRSGGAPRCGHLSPPGCHRLRLMGAALAAQNHLTGRDPPAPPHHQPPGPDQARARAKAKRSSQHRVPRRSPHFPDHIFMLVSLGAISAILVGGHPGSRGCLALTPFGSPGTMKLKFGWTQRQRPPSGRQGRAAPLSIPCEDRDVCPACLVHHFLLARGRATFVPVSARCPARGGGDLDYAGPARG